MLQPQGVAISSMRLLVDAACADEQVKVGWLVLGDSCDSRLRGTAPFSA